MSAAQRAAGAPFDDAAPTYDLRFSHTRLGSRLRERVHRRLDRCFQRGDRVLELGCGTGEDAVHLARRGVEVFATDASTGMLEAARSKVAAAGLSASVHLGVLDASVPEEARSVAARAPFDGAFANFGVVNCLADRTALVSSLKRWVRPDGYLLLVGMGPFCLFETGWQLLHGRPGGAFRRWRDGELARLEGGSSIRVWYPGPRRLARDFAPAFRRCGGAAIGVALPPSDLAPLVEHRPRIFAALDRVDRWLSKLPGVAWTADHYLLVLERAS